ncbi:DUF559 domain-containing protein [Modestobacter versicolor]|uniref:DUF559 domain-containing protein n=1 Tax=Modestobacter versicolor TaxID=429133 RepID=UPI0034DF8D31
MPGPLGDWRVRVAAAVRSRDAVVSHATALALWELAPPPRGPVHVTVAAGRSGRGTPGVVLHRVADAAWHARSLDGLPVTSVERSVVDAWGDPSGLGRPAVRAAAITAVRQRLCSARQLADELARRPRLPGRAALVELVRLLADGCRSELEIWGCLQVLRAPGLPAFVQQRPVQVAGERFVLDAACDQLLLAVEMDGAAHHGSREQRERDIRRDALLATVGWQTLRFSYQRLTEAPASCQRDIARTAAARRRLLVGDGVRKVSAAARALGTPRTRTTPGGAR